MKTPWNIQVALIEQSPRPRLVHQTFTPTKYFWRESELRPEQFKQEMEQQVVYMIRNLFKEIEKYQE